MKTQQSTVFYFWCR